MLDQSVDLKKIFLLAKNKEKERKTIAWSNKTNFIFTTDNIHDDNKST